MILPQELEVWYILPAIRSEMAKCLASKGLKHKDVAKLLGITESAISQYLRGDRAQKVKFSKKVISEIENSCNKIITEKDSAQREIQSICALLRKHGTLCEMHKQWNKVCLKCNYP
jgi:predicted transcriptional regulator